MKYYTVGEFAKLIGKNPQTLREWDKKNVLKPNHVAPTGYRYYSQEQLNHFLGLKGIETKTKKIIGYCRVSSQIITVFSSSLQGKRANKAKKMIKELLEDDNVNESSIRA